MNYSIAVFLLNDNCRLCRGIFEADSPDGKILAKRELLKTFDPTVVSGDIVMVPTGTRHGVSIMKVVEVDCDLDIDTQEDVRWVIGKVDQEYYTMLKQQEEQAVAAIKQAELRKKKKAMMETMAMDYVEDLKALPISSATPPAE
jgi:Fe-S oxidoreductase